MNDPSQQLSLREKIGYSLGDLAANLIFQTLVTFLAFFYTDVFRIPAGVAATLIFVVGMLGAFVFTPIIGILADRTRTRWASSARGSCGRQCRSVRCRWLHSTRPPSASRARSPTPSPPTRC